MGEMSKIKTIFVVLTLVTSGFAQTSANSPVVVPPSDYVAAGVHWNQFASPQIGGLAAYGHKIAGDTAPTYSFTAIEFLSVQARPFRVGTLTQTGVAQYLKSIADFQIYGLAMAGALTSASTTGTNVGFAGSTGGLATRAIGKGWSVGPYLLFTQPTNADRQWAIGVIIGFGK